MLPASIELPRIFPDYAAFRALSFDDRLASVGIELPPRIRASVANRQVEFVAGRLCAREALRAVGGTWEKAVAIGPMRAPVWPDGFVGSIAHTTGLAVAVAAPGRNALSLGVDVEHIAAVASISSLERTVAHRDELRLVADPAADPAAASAIVFSAKEALFKCIAPLVGRYFDFLEIHVVSATADTVAIRLGIELASDFPGGLTFAIRYALLSDMVFAGMTLEADQVGRTEDLRLNRR